MSSGAVALTVAVASAAISLASLAWNLTLYRLSGARLNVRLIPAILTAQGTLMRGPDKGWRKSIPDEFANGIDRDLFVDLAIIKVTNVGRAPVSVSDISLDFGRWGWRPWWRHTIGGTPIPIHECSAVKGDVRLEAGATISVAIDSRPLIDHGLSRSSRGKRSIRATATAAGRRPTRSAWRRRWTHRNLSKRYYSADPSPERDAFVEVFRAVYPHDPAKVYHAWTATTALLLRDADADASAIANEISEALELDDLANISFIVAGMKVAELLPTEVKMGSKAVKRGAWARPSTD
jgi:hypothetical protein